MCFFVKNSLLALLISGSLLVFSCSKEKNQIDEKVEPAKIENTDGLRIAWDYSTMAKIAPAYGKPAGYYGYARLKQLHDGRLACVYETSQGNIELVFSDDSGTGWGSPQTVFETKNNISMAVPEIIELSDFSILVACNPRPRQPYTDDRKFGIKVRKSTDGGQSWGDEQVIYEAQSTFDNGCWEPSFAQLPDGEVQLFFANEGIYTSSGEQNISIFRSVDFGESWTGEPEIVGFRKDRRDGMPVPLLLADKGELIVAVEDNKIGEFKPTIYREKLSSNWSDGFISENDSRRSYHPLVDPLANDVYAGAPYLARLESGEVLLSYQSTWNRSNIWDRSSMIVEVGDDNGSSFKNRTVPFSLSLTSWGLWNSISVINGNTPVAITSTNAYSNNSTEVWMIKGHVIPEYTIATGTPIVDGQLTENCWQGEWPYFIGHKSDMQLRASLCADETKIYVAVQLNGANLAVDNQNEIVFELDSERKGYEAVHSGVFAFHCFLNGSLKVNEGAYGAWEDVKDTNGVDYKVRQDGANYILEMAIPMDFIQLQTNRSVTVGLNFEMKCKSKTGSALVETISLASSDKPYSWCPVFLK